MTRTEYNEKLRVIRADLADKTVAENLRHNKELGAITVELRARTNSLNEEFTAAGGTFNR